jgi:hypothetical protein
VKKWRMARSGVGACLGAALHCEQRGGDDLARERSERGFDFDPQATKIRAVAKPWVGARQ